MNADQPAVSPVGPLESYCPRSLTPTLVGALTMLFLLTTQTWGYQAVVFAGKGSSDVEEDDWGKNLSWILHTTCQPLMFLHTHAVMVFQMWKMNQRLKKEAGIESAKLRASTKWTNSFKYWDPRSLRCLLGARSWIKLAPALPVERTTSPVAASSSKFEISNPLEIFPSMMLNQSPLHESEGDQTTGDSLSALNSPVDECFMLDGEGKQALLELGFVPSYEQLQYVKSKSEVQITIVAVQAAGYLLGILERMAADQRISPVEALATFLGILMILHAVLEFFAPAYKRTLLFHLYPPQFWAWQVRLKSIQARGSPDTWRYSQLMGLLIGLTILLPLAPAIYFAVDFLVPHDHRCLICFIAALFFSLKLILLAAFYITNIFVNITPLLFVIVLLYVSSFVLAVIGTVLEWDHKFNEPTKSWYRWIIPHIGS